MKLLRMIPAAMALALSGCGLAAVSAGVSATGSASGAAAQAPKQIQAATSATCEVERQTLSTAIEAFAAMNGAYPGAEADLVTAGLIREEVATWDLGGEGAVVPAPGSPCA